MNNEFKARMNAQSEAQEQITMDELSARINEGRKPNLKDVSWVLRNCTMVDVSRPVREYLAKVITKEIRNPEKRRYYGNNPDAVLSAVQDFTRPIYEDLLQKGFDKSESLEIMAKAEILDIFNYKLDPELIETEWNKIPDHKMDSFEEQLIMLSNRFDRTVNPRRRKP